MTTKEEVSEDILNGADALMILNSAKPTAEERKSIPLWIKTASELLAEYLTRKKSSTISTPPSSSSSSTVMESEIIPKSRVSKTNKLKSPLVRNRKIGRCFDVGTKERMPFWLARFIRDNNGVGPKMIIEKTITATDLNSNNGRLSMPFNKIADMNFLTEEEETMIEEHFNKHRDEGVNATIVDCELRRWEVNLRKWGITNSFLYNLVTGWNKVVQEISLEKDEQIRLWSFHSNGELYFALVILPPKTSSPLVIHDKPNGDLPRK